MKDTLAYHTIVNKMRNFFLEKRFIEVPVQSRLSILAACEDPKTISEFCFAEKEWPLPQTGQMWLERELLENPSWQGVYCISTSYRDEPNPILGRHDLIFPMFEFESKGNIDDLMVMERDLLRALGFIVPDKPAEAEYETACKRFGVDELTAVEEEALPEKYGSNVIFLTYFPRRTHPFWNMKRNGNGLYNKVDVILHGMETIGSAERSINVDEMREEFETISNGEYAKLLFDKFGEGRVRKELEDYLKLRMFPRFGGGTGVTRIARAMRKEGILRV